MKTQNEKIKKGYVAILVVLIIAAVGLLLATTMSLIGAGGVQAASSLTQGEQSLDFTEGCAEDALIKLWASASYAGGNITRPEGTCTITVASSSNIWTITAGTTATSYARTVQVVVTRGTTNLTVTSWQEI
jgi:hypothetical protein